MVLHDVAHRSGAVVIAGTLLDPDRLGRRDLYMVHVLTCPDRLEDAVREAEDEDVLHRLLAEVVIDAEDLVLAKDLLYHARELHRAVQVVTVWLLHHDARPSAL